MIKPQKLLLCATAVLAVATLGAAKIERLTLEDMVAKTEGAIYGEIVANEAFRTDGPDGEEMYFTRLTIEGRSLRADQILTVDVLTYGGFVTPEEGAYNSEAPSADDMKVGNRVVVFYKWADDMGNGVAGNAIYAAHGGLYRTVESPKGSVVLGRGEGYAVDKNLGVRSLETAIQTLAKVKNG